MNDDLVQGIVIFCKTAGDVEKAFKTTLKEGRGPSIQVISLVEPSTPPPEHIDMRVVASLEEAHSLTPFDETLYLSPGIIIHKNPLFLFRLKRYKDAGYLKWKDGGDDIAVLNLSRWSSEELRYLDKFEPNMPGVSHGIYPNCSGDPLFEVGGDESVVEVIEELVSDDIQDDATCKKSLQVRNEESRKVEFSREVILKYGVKAPKRVYLVEDGTVDYRGLVPGPARGWDLKESALVLKLVWGEEIKLQKYAPAGWAGRSNVANKKIIVKELSI